MLCHGDILIGKMNPERSWPFQDGHPMVTKLRPAFQAIIQGNVYGMQVILKHTIY
jgi:hypothetical protein